MIVTTAEDRRRRKRAKIYAAAAAGGRLVALRILDPRTQEEIRLANEVAVLRDELAQARGEDADERRGRHRPEHLLASTEEYVYDEGRLRVQRAGASGTADGSTYSKYSGGLVELSCPAADVAHPRDGPAVTAHPAGSPRARLPAPAPGDRCVAVPRPRPLLAAAARARASCGA